MSMRPSEAISVIGNDPARPALASDTRRASLRTTEIQLQRDRNGNDARVQTAACEPDSTAPCNRQA